MELNLVDIGKKMTIYNKDINLENKLYFLIINNTCVNYNNIYDYKLENCVLDNNNFYYIINKIDNYNI